MKVKFMEKCTQSILGNCVFKWAVRTSVRLWCHSHFPSATPTNMAMIRGPATTDSCCVSVQGLHPSTASPSETLLTSSAVVKCDGRAFGAFPGCVTRCFTLTSRFLPPRPAKVTIYATRCRHFLSFFLLFRARKESWDMWGHEGS